MKKIQVNENKGHYSAGVVSNGMLYISGQLALNSVDKTLPEGGVKAHMKQALDNLEGVLKEAGITKEDVVQCRIYITRIEDWDAVNSVYEDFFGSHKPARAVVPVGPLHYGSLVEIEAVAEVSNGR